MNGEKIAVYVIGALIFITFETFMYLFSEAREQNLQISRKKHIKKILKICLAVVVMVASKVFVKK